MTTDTKDYVKKDQISFTVLGKEYIIGDVCIKHYYDIQDLIAFEQAETQLTVVSSLSGCPVDILKKLEAHQFNTLWKEVFIRKVSTVGEKKPFHKIITLNRKGYGFVHVDKLTMAEFADLDILTTDPNREKMLHQIMAVLYRPLIECDDKGNKYTIEEYDSDSCNERAEEFKDLPLDVVHGAMSFFLTIQSTSISLTLDSLEVEAETEEEASAIRSMRYLLQSQEYGSSSSSSYLDQILLISMQLQDYLLKLASTTQPMQGTKRRKNRGSWRDRWLRKAWELKMKYSK